ncbi:MAG: hypothetical protein ACFFE5_06820 [Candidatus Thorarchaeota archaeon]
MVQVLEKQERETIYVLIPEIEEKAEKIEKKKEQSKPKLKVGTSIKRHQERVNVNKVKNKVDACRFQANIYNR